MSCAPQQSPATVIKKWLNYPYTNILTGPGFRKESMTDNEKFILDLKLHDPAFLIRPDLGRITVLREYMEQMVPIQIIKLSNDGSPESMQHIKLGWVGYPKGHLPPLKMDRLSTYRFSDSDTLSTETRFLTTNDLLEQEEYRFSNDRLAHKMNAFYRPDSGSTFKSSSEYRYNEMGHLIQITTDAIGARLNSHVVIDLKRSQDALIKMKTTTWQSKNNKEQHTSRTTYSYDQQSRIIHSINSTENELVTREYQYEDERHPNAITMIKEKMTDQSETQIEHQYNERGDRTKTTRVQKGEKHITFYEYQYL